jgi:hypothetical protein
MRRVIVLTAVAVAPLLISVPGHAVSAGLDRGALAYISGSKAQGWIVVAQEPIDDETGIACVTLQGNATMVLGQRGHKPTEPVPHWSGDSGCGNVTFTIDPLFSTATASGIIESTAYGTLDGDPIDEPSTISIAMTWTATSLPDGAGSWDFRPSPSVFARVDARVRRSAVASGSVMSAHIGEGADAGASGGLFAFASVTMGDGFPI